VGSFGFQGGQNWITTGVKSSLQKTAGGAVYGSLVYPEDFGSGGGDGRNSNGGSGGGKLKLQVGGTLINDGEISSNGNAGTHGDSNAGGGAGGSILIETGDINGSGVISASGGDAGSSVSGGGAGGRIAIYYDYNTFLGNFDVSGGIGFEKGRYGTVFTESKENSPVTTAVLEQTYTNSNTLYEDIEISQLEFANNSFEGPTIITGVNFNEFKKITITSGSFEEKGFFDGEILINTAGTINSCYCKGVVNTKEDKLYLNGALEGNGYGTVEGVINNDGTYDISLNFTEIGNQVFSEGVSLQGTCSTTLLEQYSSVQLYYLQTSVKGGVSGYYDGELSTVFTYVRINDDTNPYYNEGFTIISYQSKAGSGLGYGYGKKISDSRVDFQGLFKKPLDGFMRAKLDESVDPEVLSFTLSRIDYEKPPEPDMEIRMLAPIAVSPGQNISYAVEVINEGLAEAQNYSAIAILPEYSFFLSATEGFKFYSIDNVDTKDRIVPIPMVRWDNLTVPPKSSVTVYAQVRLFWGTGYAHRAKAYVGSQSEVDEIFRKFYIDGNEKKN
jgi:uncharacterized repeat protein (TIGR01451 family)